MNTIELLAEVRRRLTDPNKWCTGIMRRFDGAACLAGAILIATNDWKQPAFFALMECAPEKLMECAPEKYGLGKAMNGFSPVHFVAYTNDRCSHEEVLCWLDRTIAAEKAKRGVEELKGEIKSIPIVEGSEPKTEMLVH